MADIFTDTTRTIIDQEQNLNIICSAQSWKDDISQPLGNIQIPSWVPDYASRLKTWEFATSRRCGQLYNGGVQMPINDEPSTLKDAKILQQRGCFMAGSNMQCQHQVIRIPEMVIFGILSAG
jgi:hypothetical protein